MVRAPPRCFNFYSSYAEIRQPSLVIDSFNIALVPTTKECFAIAVLPKVINNEDISVIKSEAGEAWELTKQYLKTIIEEKEPKE